MRERTTVNRGIRSTSAPTPTLPSSKQVNQGNNNNYYYIRRPTVIFNDERVGPSDKTSGAQARVNHKFVNLYLFFFLLLFCFFFFCCF